MTSSTSSASAREQRRLSGVHAALAVLAALLLLALPARAQDEEAARQQREADIFGAPAAAADDDTADKPGPVEDEPEEEGAPSPASPLQELSESTIAGADVLRDLDRILDVGGRAYLAMQYTFYDDSGDPLFPPLTSPSLLDLYADARPSPRVRAYAQARLDYDFLASDVADLAPTSGLGFVRPTQELRLDQLWLKLDIERLAFLTLGKQRIRWGTGRFWNPTDFLNQDVRDPLDVFDRRLGVSLVKVHFPIEALGSNLYLIGNFEDVTLPDEVGIAARAEAVLFSTEIFTTAAVRKGQPLRFGVDVSSGVWLFDLRAEGAAVFNSSQPFFEGDIDLGRGVLPTEVSRANEWLFQLVLGGEVAIPYSATDSVTLGAEYFYNDAGYERVDLYPLLLGRGAFIPLYVGRHYAAAYAALPQPGSLDDASIIASTIANLSDQSIITRVDFATLFLTFLTLNLWGAVHYGNVGELRLGLELPPLPDIPGAEDGLTAAAPFVDVGAALTLDF